jgi:hypothetical protein
VSTTMIYLYDTSRETIHDQEDRVALPPQGLNELPACSGVA